MAFNFRLSKKRGKQVGSEFGRLGRMCPRSSAWRTDSVGHGRLRRGGMGKACLAGEVSSVLSLGLKPVGGDG